MGVKGEDGDKAVYKVVFDKFRVRGITLKVT
jgi:hypothetical protein